MNTEVYRFKVGAFERMAVRDGNFSCPTHSFFVNAPEEGLEPVLYTSTISQKKK